MRFFEIFVAPAPGAADAAAASAPPAASESRPRLLRASPAREVLDVFIEGANVTARIPDRHGACVLRDLGFALLELSHGGRGKALVRFYDEPWEMCIERLGATALLSVYRGGPDPLVAVYDRAVPFDEVVHGVRDAIAGLTARGVAPATVASELRAAAQGLLALEATTEDEPMPPSTPVVLEAPRDVPISFAAEFALRAVPPPSSEPSVERADVHALLFRGKVRAEIRGRSIDLPDAHPFLFAERLCELSRQALEAWERGQPYHVRRGAGGVTLGVRIGGDGVLALTLGPHGSERGTCTFPALGAPDLVEAALAFGRALVRAILRRDRSQGANLRFSAFRRQLRDLNDALREVCRQDAKINPSPEPYRAFVKAQPSPAAQPFPTARLRYTARWRALVPGIDLRSTFLCGDRFVVGAAAETFCLDRSSGQVLWRVETHRATSVVTPGGLARLHPDGELCVHDFGTGEVTLRSWLAPRLGGPPAGAVVHAPGLPRLLILTEGERHLVAVDLTSGESRWRFPWGRRGALRLKRSGKLLYLASGDSALTAVDVTTGAVVWRIHDRLRFRSAPTLDHDLMFAVAGGASCAATLHAIDPFSGRARWNRPLATGPAGCTIEGSILSAGSVVACAVRDRQGLKLSAFDRDSGEPLWTSPGVVAHSGTSWLAVDDLFIGNTPTGELVAVEASSGATRYRHVLGSVVEVDVPRRLEPVLRSGALYVPHSDVHVFRPADGGELSVIGPCDAIPDLLRVDERCDVYLAEESGHVASFGVGARLSLVR